MSDFEFIPGESFNGAVARWADLNGVERMMDLTRHAGVEHAHRQQASRTEIANIKALAQEMEVDPAELIARATLADGAYPQNARRLLLFGTSIPSFMLEKNLRRFAPAALAASPHHRALWDVRLLPICVETGQVLISVCSHCGKQPGWHHTMGIDTCEHCMEDLAEAVAPIVPDGLREVVKQIAGLLHWDVGERPAALQLLPGEVAALGNSGALELLIRLLPVVDKSLPALSISLHKVPPEQLCRALAEAWALMRGWPDSFAELMGRHMACRTGRHSDGNGGRTKRFLQAAEREQGMISSRVRSLIQAVWKTVDLDGPQASTILATTYSNKEAARFLAIGTAELTSLRRRGALKTTTAFREDRAEPRFDRSELDAVASAKADRIGMKEAGTELGMPDYAVEQMLALSLLEGHTHPYMILRYGRLQVRKSSIEALLARISGAAVETISLSRQRDAPSLHSLRIRDAMKAVGGRLKPWGPVMNALIDGEISFSLVDGPCPLTSRICVGPEAKNAISSLSFTRGASEHAYYAAPGSMVAYCDRMSKVDALEVLNLGTKQVTHLFARFPTRPGTKERVVPVAFVEELARIHVTATEISSRLGLSIHGAYKRIREERIPELGIAGFCRRTAEKKLFGIEPPETDGLQGVHPR